MRRAAPPALVVACCLALPCTRLVRRACRRVRWWRRRPRRRRAHGDDSRGRQHRQGGNGTGVVPGHQATAAAVRPAQAVPGYPAGDLRRLAESP